METMTEVLMIPEQEKEINESYPLPVEKDYKGLSYIPWLEARIALNKTYPNLIVNYKVHAQKITEELSYSFILLCLQDVVDKKESQALYFPVMRRGNRKNGEADFVAVENPSPLHINTAIMRGSAKLVAIETGLGRAAYRKDREDLVMSGVFEGIEVAPVKETSVPSKAVFKLPIVPSGEDNPIDGEPTPTHKKTFNFVKKQGGIS